MNKLKYGDTIGIFSPSTAITAIAPKRYKRGKEFLESKGFKIKEGKLTNKRDYYRSGSIKERAEELNELIRDPKVRCIMSTIGGMNSNSLLPYIDYDAFKKDPKIIIGYSDVTAILFAIYQKTGISTFYGPALVASFGEIYPFNEMTYKYFEDICIKGEVNYEYNMPKFWTDEYINWEDQERSKEQYKNEWITLKEGSVEGRLVVGNLNTIMGFYGSQYMIDIKEGDILLIEDSLKDAATIERAFSLLKVNGVFDRISGLILGKHELFNSQDSLRKPHEILEEVMGDYDFPLMVDVDCSHTHPLFTTVIGKKIYFNSKSKKIRLIDKVF